MTDELDYIKCAQLTWQLHCSNERNKLGVIWLYAIEQFCGYRKQSYILNFMS